MWRSRHGGISSTFNIGGFIVRWWCFASPPYQVVSDEDNDRRRFPSLIDGAADLEVFWETTLFRSISQLNTEMIFRAQNYSITFHLITSTKHTLKKRSRSSATLPSPLPMSAARRYDHLLLLFPFPSSLYGYLFHVLAIWNIIGMVGWDLCGVRWLVPDLEVVGSDLILWGFYSHVFDL
jgi:hypothetical protein